MPAFHAGDVRVLGLRVRVQEAGEGDPVILLHGLGVSGRYLRPLGQLLALRRRVVVPDLPGWGRSEKPGRPLTLEQAADVLGELLEREPPAPPLVANSFGCQVALALATRRPGVTGGLVLIGPTVDPAYRSWLRHTFQLVSDSVREPPALWRVLLGDYARMGFRRVVATAREALADRPESRLPHVGVPILVVRGQRDAITTEGWARRCAALAPAGRFAAVPGAAHAAHFSHPSVVATLVEGFLAER